MAAAQSGEIGIQLAACSSGPGPGATHPGSSTDVSRRWATPWPHASLHVGITSTVTTPRCAVKLQGAEPLHSRSSHAGIGALLLAVVHDNLWPLCRHPAVHAEVDGVPFHNWYRTSNASPYTTARRPSSECCQLGSCRVVLLEQRSSCTAAAGSLLVLGVKAAQRLSRGCPDHHWYLASTNTPSSCCATWT